MDVYGYLNTTTIIEKSIKRTFYNWDISALILGMMLLFKYLPSENSIKLVSQFYHGWLITNSYNLTSMEMKYFIA